MTHDDIIRVCRFAFKIGGEKPGSPFRFHWISTVDGDARTRWRRMQHEWKALHRDRCARKTKED